MIWLLLACSDTSLKVFNAAPLAVILLPEDGTALSNPDSLLLEGSASDPNHLESQLVVTWSVNGEVRCEGPPDEAGISTCLLDDLAEEMVIRMAVRDPMNAQDLDEIAVWMGNEAPSAPEIHITPQAPYTGESLLCAVTTPSNDPDGDALNYAMQWWVDDVRYENSTITHWPGDTIADNNTANGDLWRCETVVDDGALQQTATSNEVLVCPGVLSFDGVDDRVNLPAITDLQGDVTMETWVRLDAPPTENTLLMSSQCTSLWMNADELYVGTVDKCDISPGCSTGWNNSSEWVASNAPGGDGGFAWNDWDGSWVHIAVTISDEHRGELFINGEYMGQKTLSRDGCISTPTTGELGRHSSLGGAMAGQMAAARFVSGILYTEDFSPQYPLPTATNTVAHYQMADSATSTTLEDSSGNGFDATIDDGTWLPGGPPCE